MEGHAASCALLLGRDGAHSSRLGSSSPPDEIDNVLHFINAQQKCRAEKCYQANDNRGK